MNTVKSHIYRVFTTMQVNSQHCCMEGKHTLHVFHSEKKCWYTHFLWESIFSLLVFLLASSSASSRLQTARRAGEHVGLEVEFLLQDPRQNELSSDDGHGCRESWSTRRPVFFTWNHDGLRLRRRKLEKMIKVLSTQCMRNWESFYVWPLPCVKRAS